MSEQAIPMKVMTFNLRMRTERDGKNCFDFRRERILEVITAENPDLIGFQEATDEMLAWLKERLTDYVVLGHGRNADFHGEGTPIAYRRDYFDLHRFEELWLSCTPTVPGSRLEGVGQSQHPRVFICAELIRKDAEKPFVFCNVHTDHKGEDARVFECMMVMQRIAVSPWKFILTGDFNDRPDSRSIRCITATAETLGTVDATEIIPGSLHFFTGEAKDRKIDYIFTNLPADPKKSYAVADQGKDGVFYSDHFALCSFIEI